MSKVFVISGPSGSGKTTLLGEALKDRKLKRCLVQSVSLTTRPKRTGEKNGRDYFFISKSDFRRRQRAKKILEWTKYLGYYYATPKDLIGKGLARSKHLVLCLDLKGARYIKRAYPANAVTIFVAPPSLELLRHRIANRCPRTKQGEIKKRLLLARKEVLASGQYDYCVMNKELAHAVKQLRRIILKEIEKIKE